MHADGYLANAKDAADFTFPESEEMASCTSETVPRLVRWLGKGVYIMIIDTPGLSDTGGHGNDKEQLTDLVKTTRRVPGVSVFLIVLDCGKTRWTKEQDEVLEVFDTIFSTAETTFLDHCVFLYNKSDGQFFGRKKAARQTKMQQAVAEQLRKIFTPELTDLVSAEVQGS